jgi:adenosylcobinamide-phosphate synthase
MEKLLMLLPLLAGYAIDYFVGDPDDQPHPVRVFGTAIYRVERKLNQGKWRFLKGALMSVALCLFTYAFFSGLQNVLLRINVWLVVLVNSIWVWYGLANRSLITEGLNVFKVLETQGLEAGRLQLSRIVGRDTSQLSAQNIRIAVLETMSENLSDGVIAPLFFYALGGVPGMMVYKMINTLDSMIGYRNDRYEQFGKFAARLDDVANYIPARLTALLMVLITRSRLAGDFVLKYGNKHKSPNSGYPEAALAGIMNCRFGGPNLYKGVLVDKPFIGQNDRVILPKEIETAVSVNHRVCFLMVVLILIVYILA